MWIISTLFVTCIKFLEAIFLSSPYRGSSARWNMSGVPPAGLSPRHKVFFFIEACYFNNSKLGWIYYRCTESGILVTFEQMQRSGEINRYYCALRDQPSGNRSKDHIYFFMRDCYRNGYEWYAVEQWCAKTRKLRKTYQKMVESGEIESYRRLLTEGC